MGSDLASLRLIRKQDGLALAELADVYIAVWRGSVTRPRFEAQRAGLVGALARRPEGAGFLCVIEPTAKPPGEELRRASAQMVRDHEAKLRCIACVVEGSGFANAIARSALSAMAFMLGPRRSPFAIHRDVTLAGGWMAPHVSVKDPGAIERAVTSLREGLVADL